MKTTLVCFATVIAFLAVFHKSSPSTPSLISTNGSAQIRVVPDLADLYFEVEVRHADLTTARQQQAERARKVLAALRAAGVAEAELQSSQVQIAPDYADSDRSQETEKVRFYRVTQSICCTLNDLKKVSEVTADAVVAGATGVRDASLRTSQLRKYRDEARAQAIHAAQEKATLLAAALGARVGRSYTITEGADNEASPNANMFLNTNSIARTEQTGDGTQSAFAPGTISVDASVSVSFVLE